jgi:quercetin dioxygenase-like cupin family protein
MGTYKEKLMEPIDLKELPELQLAEGIEGHVVTADSFTVAHVSLKCGALLPEHSHYHEQVVNVTWGQLELTVQGTPFLLTPGKVMVLPPNVPHSGKAITDVQVIDVFHPVRKDFVGGSFSGYEE